MKSLITRIPCNIYMASVTRKRTFGYFTQCRPRSASLTMLKTPIRNQTVHTARSLCAIDVTSVKNCKPRPDAASETRRLVWVYTFCICPKVLFGTTLAIYSLQQLALQLLAAFSNQFSHLHLLFCQPFFHGHFISHVLMY